MEKNSKVTTFKKRKENKPFANNNKKLLIKEDFPYLKMNKDVNGFKFNIDHLSDYASEIKYTITLANCLNDNTTLFYYFVDSANLTRFFKLHSEGKIEGDIIEIDKFNPEILA